MNDRRPYGKANVKRTKDHTAEIEGEIPAEILAAHEAAAFAEVLDAFEAPGFRKGKVPEDIVRKHVSPMHILEEAAEPAIDEAYRAIVEEEGIEPLGTPQVTITKIAPGNPLGFAIRVSVMPEFRLSDYKAIARGVIAPAAAEDAEAKRRRREDIAANLIEKTDITLPPLLVAEELAVMQDRRRAEIERLGITLEEHLKQAGKSTEEELAKDEQAYIERQMKTKFIFDAIAAEEDIEAEDEEIERNLQVLRVRHPEADPDALVNYIRAMLVNEKVLRFLEEQK